MNERKRFLLLAVTMVAAFAAVVGVTIGILYVNNDAGKRQALQRIVQSQARLMEAVARHDLEHAELIRDEEPDYDSLMATLNQVRDAQENHGEFGETGEILLARREGDAMVFLFPRRHETAESPDSISFDSNLAEPTRRALKGLSGTVAALDYRGKMVLAAYEPVAVLNLGIVAKMDMAEVRAPFIRSGLIAAAIALLIVVAVTAVFFRIGNPIIARLERYSRDLEGEVEQRRHAEEALRMSRDNLEAAVQERTAELEAANKTLEAEVVERKQAVGERDRLFNHSLDLLCVAGFDGFFRQLNPAWQETLGWTVEELKAKPWLDLVHPDDRAATRRQGEQLARGEAVRDFENRYRHKDGSYRWLSWNSYPQPGEQIIFAMVRDVTERKQAEEEIKSQLKELQRWQNVMLDREARVQELKREVNELCRSLDKAVRYPSQEAGPADSEEQNS